MKKNTIDEIENISLSAKQIKAKLEDSLAYDHDKVRNVSILFATNSGAQKLPFSSFKISISEEMYGQQLLNEDIQKHLNNVSLIEEKVEDDIEIEIEPEEEIIPAEVEIVDDFEEEEIRPTVPTVKEEEVAPHVNIVEEICEFDDIIELEDDYDNDEEEEEFYAQLPHSERAKRPKGYTIKVVDVAAVIRKIKKEAIEKNAGKPVIGRRQINKMLKPYIIHSNDDMNIEGIEKSQTSIDIYLSAVDKINATNSTNKNSSGSLELDINEILKDLDKNN